jgi:hypothetical protein
MALGIAFYLGGSSIDFSQSVMGLDQKFYESLFRYYEKRESDSLLKKMILIGYDDELFFVKSQVIELMDDLMQLLADGSFAHSQTSQFCDVLREAVNRNCGIVVWGDMYPDLSQTINPRTN